MSSSLRDKVRRPVEFATIRQTARIRPEFVMATDAEVPTTTRYDVDVEIVYPWYQGKTYHRDPDHKHEPVGDMGAYALVMKHHQALWRGYSDGWEAIREMDAIQSWAIETGDIVECAPEAVVDREGRARWMRL